MKISVLIIAHNEERHIADSIESILAQTRQADEVVLVAHNSSDRTAEIARRYPIRVIEYTGPSGAAYARIRGFEEVSGDIVLCIDGDAVAAKNWIEVMSEMLHEPKMVMVGSWIKMSGAWYAALGSYRWYFFCNARGERAADWLWGASLGFWTRDRGAIIEGLNEGIRVTKELNLPYNPDDYFLALFMARRGDLMVTNRTFVTAYAKETSVKEYFMRGFVAYFSVSKKIREWMKKHPTR